MRRWIFSLCALILLAAPPSAHAQLYLRLVGETQGPIDGDVVFGPLTGTVLMSSFQLSVATPIDPVSGLPVGVTLVSPLTFTKATDSATLGIMKALRAGERLTTCQLDAYRPNGQGGTQFFLRLTLTNARVAELGLSAGGSALASESLSIVFSTLEWRDFITGDVYTYTMGTSTTQDVFGPDLALATAPNPTSGPTEFAFRLPQTGSVSINVYDTRGRHVATVFEGATSSEQGIVSWDGRDALGQPVANGIYLVKMRAGGWLTTQKMSVLR